MNFSSELSSHDTSYCFSEPLVSVICITYNHVKFIEAALNGFVSQKTNFPFEVIVADDCSTDGTQLIIQKYAAAHPSVITPIIRAHNIGINSNYFDAILKAKGTFLAICDGDDYWTDTHKLQKQYDFLNSHPDFSMCCHPVLQHYVDDSSKDQILYPLELASSTAKKRGFLLFQDFFTINPVPSVSAMYRWSFVKSLPPWITNYQVADLTMNLLHADKGPVGVLDEIMAVYQRHPNGIWFRNEDKEHIDSFALSLANMYVDLDYELKKKHTNIIAPHKNMPLKILFLAIENSIHAYKWIKTVSEITGYTIQIYSTYKISNAPDLFSQKDNLVLYSFANKPPLEEVIENFQPDVIHSLHTQLSAYPILKIKMRSSTHFPIWIDSIWGSDLFFWMREENHNKRLRELLKNLDYIIGEGKRDNDLANLLGFSGKYLGSLPASVGIDFEKILKIPFFSPSQRKEIMVKGYDRGVGRFRDVLVALTKLKDRLKNYRINIYSLEMDEDMFHVYVNDAGLNVRVIPQSNNEEMLELFSKARIAIACSFSDGLPGSLLESMACGAFPIQTNTAITEGWVVDKISALLIPPDDVNAIVDAISLALSNDDLVDNAAQLNRETIKQKANLLKQANSIEKMYNEVAFENLERIKSLRKVYKKSREENSTTNDNLFDPRPTIRNQNNTFITKLKRLLVTFKDSRMIKKSPFFDADWYLKNNLDVKNAKADPIRHYLNFGGFEGRDPSIWFDSSWYLSEYLDVHKSGMNPLVHYLRFGRFENRNPKKAASHHELLMK